MLLTDLNIDCLESILDYLQLGDLLNVSDSNKRLNYASKFVFIRKYGNCAFQFGDFTSKSRQSHIHVYNNRSYNIHGLKTFLVYSKSSLQLLRNFGPFIHQILLYDDKTNNLRFVYIDYINDFCSETLDILSVQLRGRDLLKCFKNPFTQVKTVYLFLFNDVSMQQNSLVRLFPKIQKLILWAECSKFMHSGFLAYHFPHLEYFKRESYELFEYQKDNECVEIIKDFLRLNPQLKHFGMPCGAESTQADINILQMFGEREHQLERLELIDVDGFINQFNGEKLHLKNIKHLSISPFVTFHVIKIIPFSCNNLEIFEIDLFGGQSYEHIYEFLEKNPSIKKLKIIDSRPEPEFLINISRLAQLLPLLEEFQTSDEFFASPIDETVHTILFLFKHLKFVRFGCYKQFDCKNLRSRLNKNWSMNFTSCIRSGTFITLKHKDILKLVPLFTKPCISDFGW